MATKLWPFYNVDYSVGRNGTNRSDDVLLVQFFLTEIAKGKSLPIQPPSSKLAVDGICTPTLIEWIMWFQNTCKSVGKVIVVDGKVDHAPGLPHWADYTIGHMNGSYRKRYRASHNALEDDRMVPGPLRTKFASDDLAKI